MLMMSPENPFEFRRMTPDARVFVAGHRGLVGSALVDRLSQGGYHSIVTRSRDELDLTNQAAVDAFFRAERPEFVLLAAAKVGGILANDTFRADFIRDNLLIQTHVIDAAYRHGVQRLLFLGSSCIYPRQCPQPMKEEYLLTGPLEPTNEPYAIAKIAGIKMCQSYNHQYGTRYLTVMPTNLYGPNDNFDLTTSHVLPALLRKFHEAHAHGEESVTIWGTGEPRREFLHVRDLADACIFLLEKTDAVDLVNIGAGEDVTIHSLARLIADIIGFDGEILRDLSKPDGTPRKLLDVSTLHRLGWKREIQLEDGIRETYRWYLEHVANTSDEAGNEAG
jgi:GDP-L-fucose synthase